MVVKTVNGDYNEVEVIKEAYDEFEDYFRSKYLRWGTLY